MSRTFLASGMTGPLMAVLAAFACSDSYADSPSSYGAGATCAATGVPEINKQSTGDTAPRSVACYLDSANDNENPLHAYESDASSRAIETDRKIGLKTSATVKNNERVVEYASQAAGIASADAERFDSFEVLATSGDARPVLKGGFDIVLKATGQLNVSAPAGEKSLSEASLRWSYEVSSSSACDPGAPCWSDSKEYILTSKGALAGRYNVNDPIVVHVSYQQGDTFTFRLAASAESKAALGGTGAMSSSVSFENSLDWLGITNFVDESGVPVASFTAISPETGLDWGTYAGDVNPAPVPEPETYALMLAGLAAMGAVARRSKLA